MVLVLHVSMLYQEHVQVTVHLQKSREEASQSNAMSQMLLRHQISSWFEQIINYVTKVHHSSGGSLGNSDNQELHQELSHLLWQNNLSFTIAAD